MSEVLLECIRGGKVESRHRADAIAVDASGRVLWEFGEGQRQMFWRSSAKPFQLLPLIHQGGVERFGLTLEEVALMASSHSGEETHVNLVEGILRKIGLTSEELDCGAAEPLDAAAAKALAGRQLSCGKVHNGCSGKHSGMLALAQLLGLPVKNYIDLQHPLQQVMHQAVAEAANLDKESIEIGIDGCGVPVFYLPLYNMALAYARLAQPQQGYWGDKTAAVSTIQEAMRTHPHAVAGSGRIDTALTEVTKGRIIAKFGSEAVYCMSVVTEGIGIAFKIDDGSYRALAPAAVAVLRKLGLLQEEEINELEKLFPPVLTNHRGDVIGFVRDTL